MKYKTIIRLITICLVAIMLMFTITACSSAVTDEATAIKVIEQKLNTKYDDNFKVIAIEEKAGNSKSDGKVYEATVTSVDSVLFFKATYSKGRISDNYKEAGEYGPYEAKIREITAKYAGYKIGDINIDYRKAFAYWSDISKFDNTLSNVENIKAKFSLYITSVDFGTETTKLYSYFGELQEANISADISVCYDTEFGEMIMDFTKQEQTDLIAVKNKLYILLSAKELADKSYAIIEKYPEITIKYEKLKDQLSNFQFYAHITMYISTEDPVSLMDTFINLRDDFLDEGIEFGFTVYNTEFSYSEKAFINQSSDTEDIYNELAYLTDYDYPDYETYTDSKSSESFGEVLNETASYN